MPRKPQFEREDARLVGGLLRDLRRAAGFRAVKDAAAAEGSPAARQTIYAYERGGLCPSLPQFLELVEFYALKAAAADPAIRHMAIAAIHRALALPMYHVRSALELIERLQPEPSRARRRGGAASEDEEG